VSENRVIRRTSGPKRDEMTRGWRKLPNEELHNFYSSPYIISMIKSRRNIWAGHMAHTGEMRNSHRILARKLEKMRPLGRPRNKWEDNIKMDIKKLEWKGVGWIHVALDIYKL
jgi:hypothetical protein